MSFTHDYKKSGAILLSWFNMDKYIHYKVLDEITYPFPHFFNGAAIGVWEWISNFTSPTIYWTCNYLSILGLTLNHVRKRGPIWR